jgi:hypothetical protein
MGEYSLQKSDHLIANTETVSPRLPGMSRNPEYVLPAYKAHVR